MDITCDVIKDLLPLYLENMLSDDSRTIVEGHLKDCQECRNCLDGMRNFKEIPADRDAKPLIKIKSTLYKKKIQTVILSVMIALAFFVTAAYYLTAPEYNPYDKRGVTIKEVGNGLVMAEFGDNVYGYDISSYPTDDNTGYVYHIITWNSIWNRIAKRSDIKNTIINTNGEKVAAVYYYQANGVEDILIFGKDINPGGGVVTLPRLFLTYYAIIAIVIAEICGLVMLIMYRRNRKVNNIVMKIFLLPVSYLLAHLIIKGFISSSYTATRDFFAILLVMILIYIALLMLISIIRFHKNQSKLNQQR